MPALKDSFTSTGAKFFAHQEAMAGLKNGHPRPITCHIMPTDHCAHKCAFCSVHHRAKNVLKMSEMQGFIEILLRYGLKSCIISGGGNPILYRCPETGAKFDDLVAMISGYGLEIGLITDGMPLMTDTLGRRVWRNVSGATLDRLTWVRISMAGLDHEENCVHVPDLDTERTTLGFSYVFHDIYITPEEPAHGKVSTEEDLIRLKLTPRGVRKGEDRIPELTKQIRYYVEEYSPRYVRMLPNCLQPDLIPKRCEQLQEMANAINPSVCFVQRKPPAPHTACWLGYIHPVLNSCGRVFPCDSVVLNPEAEHKFDEKWSICHWSEIAQLYENPAKSLIRDPRTQCKGCVFGASNVILDGVVHGTIEPVPPTETPTHVNFV